jgi:hypothetical protein
MNLHRTTLRHGSGLPLGARINNAAARELARVRHFTCFSVRHNCNAASRRSACLVGHHASQYLAVFLYLNNSISTVQLAFHNLAMTRNYIFTRGFRIRTVTGRRKKSAKIIKLIQVCAA